MKKRRNSWSLIVGLIGLGLTALSMISSAQEAGTPYCQAQVKAQTSAAKAKPGVHVTEAAKFRMMESCSEATVGILLENFYGNTNGLSDKEQRCQNTVQFSARMGLEDSNKSKEELFNDCLSLPNEHVAACGIPNPGEYFVVENQLCVAKAAPSAAQFSAKNLPKKGTSGQTGEPGEELDGQPSGPDATSVN